MSRITPAARRRIVQIAQSQVGKKERGDNRGEILKYPGKFGRGPEAWCSDFVSWVDTRAGRKMNEPYVPSQLARDKDRGDFHKRNPKPGDRIYFDWNKNGVPDHIGIVKKAVKGGVKTIEGNTQNPKTGQEGVWNRVRTWASHTILGFGTP
ncbi:MAG: CHAP domain-containing protein [Myxococcaceae bacterium]